MGFVIKARQQCLNRVVALKMILAGSLADSSDVERLRLEAQAAGRLNHPNIVPIHEIGDYEGRHYFPVAPTSVSPGTRRIPDAPHDANRWMPPPWLANSPLGVEH